jgi:hypothetical protein
MCTRGDGMAEMLLGFFCDLCSIIMTSLQKIHFRKSACVLKILNISVLCIGGKFYLTTQIKRRNILSANKVSGAVRQNVFCLRTIFISIQELHTLKGDNLQCNQARPSSDPKLVKPSSFYVLISKLHLFV